jgi:2-iminobutanoate/2-iminopropanoate deaminase
MREIIFTPSAPNPIGPYSQAVKTDSLIYLSGQIPVDPQSGTLIEADIALQTKQIFANIAAVLDTAGSSFSNVLKTTVFLTDMNNFPVMNEIYASYFNSDDAPARSTIQVSALPLGSLVEVEVIAEI